MSATGLAFQLPRASYRGVERWSFLKTLGSPVRQRKEYILSSAWRMKLTFPFVKNECLPPFGWSCRLPVVCMQLHCSFPLRVFVTLILEKPASGTHGTNVLQLLCPYDRKHAAKQLSAFFQVKKQSNQAPSQKAPGIIIVVSILPVTTVLSSEPWPVRLKH